MVKNKKFKKTPSSFAKKSVLMALTALFSSTAIYAGKDLVLEKTHSVFTFETPVELYSNQANDKLDLLYLDAIGQAKESIFIVIYSLIDGRVIEALNERVEKGVPVYIVCDAKACPGINRKIPDATVIRRIGNGLVHQKILVIDKEKILLGSANFTYSSLNTHGNLVVALKNRQTAETLIRRIQEMGEEQLPLTPLVETIPHERGQEMELWLLPNEKAGVHKMISLLRAAKKSIKVAMFTWTRKDYTEELIAAKKRGVKVDVVIDRYSGKGASGKIVKMLEKNGIPPKFNTGKGLLHHKFAYIDDSILINGSANWTESAFKLNDDYFLVIPSLNADQKSKMNVLWETIQKQSALPDQVRRKK